MRVSDRWLTRATLRAAASRYEKSPANGSRGEQAAAAPE